MDGQRIGEVLLCAVLLLLFLLPANNGLQVTLGEGELHWTRIRVHHNETPGSC
jgi:hypothetical protein